MNNQVSRNVLAIALVSSVLVLLCYRLIDIPVVYWAHQHHLQQLVVLKYCTYLVNILWCFTPSYLLYIVIKLTYKPLDNTDKLLLQAVVTLIVALFLKDILKYIFGRYWPATWQGNNLSLLHDKAYGFHFFHSGVAYSSFPSGHATAIFTMAATLWYLFPRWRVVYIISCLGVSVGLIGMQYHFVSDVIAGAGLGLIVSHYSFQIKKPLSLDNGF